MEDILVSVAKLYLETCDDSLRAIQQAIEANDTAKLRQSAHNFKGVVGNFKSEKVVDLAFLLEQNGREGIIDNAQATFNSLFKESAELKQELSALCKGLTAS